MGPVFASPDIAVLIAAFPPPTPTKDRPSLVKSRSGNNLLDSRKVLARFRVLLDTSPERISKADLPARLGIERADWLLDCYNGELYYDRSLERLLPTEPAREIAEHVGKSLEYDFIDVAELVVRHNITRQSLQRLLAFNAELDLVWVSLKNGKEGVGDRAALDRLDDRLLSVMQKTAGCRCSLAETNDSLSVTEIMKRAQHVLEIFGIGGSLEWDGSDIIYMPADYEKVLEQKRGDEFDSKANAALEDLLVSGFCDLSDRTSTDGPETLKTLGALVDEVIDKFRRGQNSDAALSSFNLIHREAAHLTMVVAKQSLIGNALAESYEIFKAAIEIHRIERQPKLSLQAVEEVLCDDTSYLGLTKRLLDSPEHRTILQKELSSAMKAVEEGEVNQFESFFQESFSAPLELYGQGVRSIADETLKSRLDEHVRDHFQNELLSDLQRALGRTQLLRDKARARDFDKFSTISAEAKTLADIQSTTNKFCRKQKLATPDAARLRKVKHATLCKKSTALKNTTRPSDVLQNCVWVVLAQENDGLFVSSGKDTSRMIKAIGDVETRQKLEQWRDLLKADTQSEGDVQAMREMATEIVNHICGDRENERGG